MTEEEARTALFELHFEYMTHSSKERLKLYDEYRAKRNQIMEQLREYKLENNENKIKTK